MADFFTSIGAFFNSTQIPEQIHKVDAAGLFSNPWFMVPFLGLVGYFIYKKALNNLVIVALVIVVWLFTGSHFVSETFKGGVIQPGKILPVVGFGVAVIGVLVYFLFMRSD